MCSEVSLILYVHHCWDKHRRRYSSPDALYLSPLNFKKLKAEFVEIVGVKLAGQLKDGGPFYTMQIRVKHDMTDKRIDFIWY